ncbi:hypothetical protein AAVH_34398 [Aphelenchoides avenae]|nr:hypothetical protein AAVH_34398 [Aphelenchus avenae]
MKCMDADDFIDRVVENFTTATTASQHLSVIQLDLLGADPRESKIVTRKDLQQMLRICFHAPKRYAKSVPSHSEGRIIVRLTRRAYPDDVANIKMTCAKCEVLLETEANRSECSTPVLGQHSPVKPANEHLLSITTSRAESLINGLPGRNNEDTQTDEEIQDSVKDLSARLEKLQPANRSSPFYDHMEKGILDAITEAWKKVRETGTAGEMISLGLDAYALAAKYNPPSSK